MQHVCHVSHGSVFSLPLPVEEHNAGTAKLFFALAEAFRHSLASKKWRLAPLTLCEYTVLSGQPTPQSKRMCHE